MKKIWNWAKRKLAQATRKLRVWSFLLSVLQYGLQGLKQFFGYAKKLAWLRIVTVISVAVEVWSVFKILQISDIKGWRRAFAWLFLIVGVGAFVGVSVLFHGTSFFGLDIHGAEYLAHGFFTLALLLAGGDPIGVILANYPGLFIHKVLVNLGLGSSIWSMATDDPAGKWWSMKILGIKIRMPRWFGSQRVRLGLAIVSIAVGIFFWFKKNHEEKDIPKSQDCTCPLHKSRLQV